MRPTPRRCSGLLLLLLLLLAVGPAPAAVRLSLLGEFRSGAAFGAGGAEIVDWWAEEGPGGERLLTVYVVNGGDRALDIVGFDDPARPVRLLQVPLRRIDGEFTDGPTSVAVDPLGRGVAVAIPHGERERPGWVATFQRDGTPIDTFPTAALPDMLVFTPDGSKLVVANEGEPTDDYSVDPEGLVTIYDTSAGLAAPPATLARFTAVPEFGEVRHFGPNADNPAQDFEPEYIAVTADSSRAFVCLQEANAIAELDLGTGRFVAVRGLGYKDHSLPENAFDPSDSDGGIAIGTWPVFGMYQPDGIAVLETGGRTYLLTANEGDSREYNGFDEEERGALYPVESPLPPDVMRREALGRLNITNTMGDTDGNIAWEALYSFGARSLSVWDASDTTAPLFDTGSAIEELIAGADPAHFNSNNNDNASFDSRSDDKGPEPEAVTLGAICGRQHAFVGLERYSAILVYDLENPESPEFVTMASSRDFSAGIGDATSGGYGPEGLSLVPAELSPTGEAILLVANEVSATIDAWEVVDDECFSCAPLEFPGATAASASNACSAEVTWEAAAGEGAVAYRVHRSESCPATQADPVVASGLSDTSWTDEDLVPGASHCYLVVAEDSCAPASAAANLPSAELTVPELSAIELLMAAKEGEGIRFTWQPDPAAGGYHLNAGTDRDRLAGTDLNRPPLGLASAECDNSIPECLDADALLVPEALIFYQLFSACGPEGGDEGPR